MPDRARRVVGRITLDIPADDGDAWRLALRDWCRERRKDPAGHFIRVRGRRLAEHYPN
jgi:hypothetical protein